MAKRRRKRRKAPLTVVEPDPPSPPYIPSYRRLRDVDLSACPNCPDAVEFATEHQTPGGARYLSIRHVNGRICHRYLPREPAG
jgi:hypothetical protein